MKYLIVMASAALVVLSAMSESHAASSANECVSIIRRQTDAGVTYSLSNECGMPLTCGMSWTVECQNAGGKVTSRERGSSRFELSTTDAHDVLISAEKCTSGWDLADVGWNCTKK
jgi:hypothetical protein